MSKGRRIPGPGLWGRYRLIMEIEIDGFLNQYFNKRFNANKNILIGVVGGTGSGKSWACLSIAESWYKHHFDEQFPIANVCWNIKDVMKRITSGELRKGEILVLEEGGVNLNSLEFQTKLSKLFNYILQSFRFKQIGLIVNLPIFEHLNKQARSLLHVILEMDPSWVIKNNQVRIKPFILQVNSITGKTYKKYPKKQIDGKVIKVRRIYIGKPSDQLITTYQNYKNVWFDEMARDVMGAIETLPANGIRRKELTESQKRVYDLFLSGKTPKEISKEIGFTQSSICKIKYSILKKGYSIEKIPKTQNSSKKMSYFGQIDLNRTPPNSNS